MTHMWHDLVMLDITYSCVIWLIHVWQDCFTRAPSADSDMTYTGHDLYVTCLRHVGHESCVTWLIHVWQDCFTRAPPAARYSCHHSRQNPSWAVSWLPCPCLCMKESWHTCVQISHDTRTIENKKRKIKNESCLPCTDDEIVDGRCLHCLALTWATNESWHTYD